MIKQLLKWHNVFCLFWAGLSTSPSSSKSMHHSHNLVPSLYHGIDDTSVDSRNNVGSGHGFSFDMDTTPSGLTTKLGIILPNPAPDVNPITATTAIMPPPVYNSVAPKTGKSIFIGGMNILLCLWYNFEFQSKLSTNRKHRMNPRRRNTPRSNGLVESRSVWVDSKLIE